MDPLTLLGACAERGLLDDRYWIYSTADETRIALQAVVEVVLEADRVRTFREGILVGEEQAIDPFAQVGASLEGAVDGAWRAYGFIKFDTASFYYPYKHRSAGALMRFVVPRAEYILDDGSTDLNSVDDPTDLIAATRDRASTRWLEPNLQPLDTTDRDGYMKMVTVLLRQINGGCLEKAILARQVDIAGSIDLLSTYSVLRRHLSSTGRAYAFRQPDLLGVGLSPEVLVRSNHGGSIETIVLAGTRPRRAHATDDEAERTELERDSKEIKEHKISVKVATQELASVCDGEVAVVEPWRIVQTPTVQHLSSTIRGHLAPNCTVWDALRALFPGVTVSGSDKHSAVAAIDSLESRPRGLYAGSVGWIDSDGCADLAIALRSAFQDNAGTTISGGAGIISESIPANEYEETAHKLRTMQETLVLK